MVSATIRTAWGSTHSVGVAPHTKVRDGFNWEVWKRADDSFWAAAWNGTKTLASLYSKIALEQATQWVKDNAAPGEKEEAFFVVTSTPAGGSVYIDGKDSGLKTDTSKFAVEPGYHTIELRVLGFAVASQRKLARLNKTTTVNFVLREEEPPKIARVKVSSTPSNASITIPGIFVGKTPTPWIELPMNRTFGVVVTKDGFETWDDVIITREAIDFTIHATLKETVRPDEWEAQVRALRKPANWPAKYSVQWDALINGLLTKDKTKILQILRQSVTQETSPAALITIIIAVAGLLSLIVAVIGSYPFAAFLSEETMQTYDMAIYKAMDLKQWDLATQATRMKEEFLTPTLIDIILGAIPFANVSWATKEFTDASRLKLDIDKELIARETPSEVIPDPGNIIEMARAKEEGRPTDPYLPTPGLPESISLEVYGKKELIDSRYWDVVNAIKIPDKKLATENLDAFNDELQKLNQWVEANKAVFQKSKAYERQLSYLSAKASTAKTLQAQIEALKVEEFGSIAVNTTPTGATIWLGTMQWKFPSNTVIDDLAPATYKVRVELEGYRPHEADITVEKDVQSPFVHAFEEIPEEIPKGAGRLQILIYDDKTGADLAASLMVNNILQKYHLSKWVLDLAVTAHEIHVSEPGYEPYLDTISIEEGKLVSLPVRLKRVAEPEPPEAACETYGYLSKAGEPPEAYEQVAVGDLTCWKLKEEEPVKGVVEALSEPAAEVWIAGIKQAEETPTRIELDPGIYDVSFKQEGYFTTTRTAYVRAGELTRVSVVLRETKEPPPTRRLARVSLNSDPTGAKILVNGVFTKKYTPDYVLLEPGEYELCLTKSGYKTWCTPLKLVEE